MGYVTYFNLEILRPETIQTDEEIIDDLRKFSDEAAYCLDESGCSEESGKWYDYEENMKEFSKKYPGLIFKLEGKGEENEDMWTAYFQNGKMQVAQAIITYEDFDPAKLQ